jgi:hypothetical protein
LSVRTPATAARLISGPIGGVPKSKLPGKALPR